MMALTHGLMCLSPAMRLHFPPQFILAPDVAGREVKRHHAGGAGFSRQHAGLRRGEVAPLCGKRRVLLQECRLDEELIGAAGERDDFCAVRVVESRVHHVGDSMPGRGAQRGNGGEGSGRRRNASCARNSPRRPTRSPSNSAAVSRKSSDPASRRFQL